MWEADCFCGTNLYYPAFVAPLRYSEEALNNSNKHKVNEN